MASINMHEAKTQLSRLVERAANGEEIIIARAGRPVAKLIPFTEERKPRQPGSLRGKIWMADDFDELPPDLLEEFYKPL